MLEKVVAKDVILASALVCESTVLYTFEYYILVSCLSMPTCTCLSHGHTSAFTANGTVKHVFQNVVKCMYDNKKVA